MTDLPGDSKVEDYKLVYGLLSAVFHLSRDEINRLEFPAFFGYWNSIDYVLKTQHQSLAHQVGKITVEILKGMR